MTPLRTIRSLVVLLAVLACRPAAAEEQEGDEMAKPSNDTAITAAKDFVRSFGTLGGKPKLADAVGFAASYPNGFIVVQTAGTTVGDPACAKVLKGTFLKKDHQYTEASAALGCLAMVDIQSLNEPATDWSVVDIKHLPKAAKKVRSKLKRLDKRHSFVLAHYPDAEAKYVLLALIESVGSGTTYVSAVVYWTADEGPRGE